MGIKKWVCSVTAVLAIVAGMPHELKTSEQGLAHIANQEGCRAKAYQCSADVWTAGLGHTQGIKQGDVLSHQQIANYFVADVGEAEQVVNRHLTASVTQPQYDMMVSFVFNLGSGNFIRSTLLKLFNQSNPKAACDQFIRWVFVNGKDCRLEASNCEGIPKRRNKERSICLHGYPTPA